MTNFKEIYQGQQVSQPEREVLLELEVLLGEPIHALDFIDSFKFGFVTRKGHVTRLGIAGKDLTRLPEDLGNLSSLEEMTILSNKLMSLPESIGVIKPLRFLSIINNRLKTLPNSIGQLKSLQFLYLNDNQLEFLKDIEIDCIH